MSFRIIKKVGLFRPLFYSIIWLIGLSSCSPSSNEELRHDYYPSKTHIEYATNFTVEYFKSYKKVDVFENGDTLNRIQRYYLVEHGTKAPEIEENAELIRIPISSTSCLSTTQISYLSFLDQVDKISGVGHASFIKDSLVQKQIAKGWTVEITRSGYLDKELLLQSNTSLLMANSFDKSGLVDLKTLGIPVIYSSEYSENNVLARAEWLKFFALFFNAEEDAKEIFATIERDYMSIKEELINLKGVKNVMFGSYYQGLWFVPGGSSLLASLISDAGANYIYADQATSKNIQVDPESIFEKMNSIDYWGMVLSKESPIDIDDFIGFDNRLKEEASQKNIHFYYSNSNRVDYFGMANVEPHILLRDLGKIFHPELFTEHQFVYFQSLN